MHERRQCWKSSWALALGLALVVGASARAAARQEVDVENLRVGFASPDRNNLYKIGAWTPVWVQLRAGDERFSGVVELVVPDDGGTPTAVRLPVDIPARESRQVTLYARPGTTETEFQVRAYDDRGRLRMEKNGASLAQVSSMFPTEVLALLLGKPSGVDLVRNLPGFGGGGPTAQPGTAGTPSELTVARVDALSGMMPGRWYGYDAATTIVLDTNDREVMSALNALRGRALIDWVRRGGHLVVAVSSNWQATRDSVIAALLPALPAGQERVGELGALESFAGAPKPISPAGSPPVMVAKFEEVEKRGGKVLSQTASVPLVVRGAFGFGRVTLIGIDVDQRPFADWVDRPLFWVRAMDLRHLSAETQTGPLTVGGGRRLYQANVSDLATSLREALEQFPGVTLVPFAWVAFFIFLYILLIGPGDYFFLKKVVKRMELTWVTFPLIVLTVSLLAYYAAYSIKGNDLRVNKLDIVDVDQPAKIARGATFVDVFSPQNRDYDVAVVPRPLDAPAGSEAGVPGTEVVLTWFGVPEAGFGGMGGGGRFGMTRGGYSYMPMGSAEELKGVRVPIWSTKTLMGRWFGPAPASTDLIEADLQPVGTDRLSGTLTNRAGMVLKDAILAFGKQVYLLGDVAPGTPIRVELMQDRSLAGYLRSKEAASPTTRPRADGAPLNRGDLALEIMFHDSLASASAEAELANRPLQNLDLTGQLALDRPMLVGRIDAPAARLALRNNSKAPLIDQTTMLRVILPLGEPPADEATEADAAKR